MATLSNPLSRSACPVPGRCCHTLVMPEIKGGSVVAYCRANNSAAKAVAISDWSGIVALPPYVGDTAGLPASTSALGSV